MAPPYPELVEESRKHRELYESSIFPNNTTHSYFSLPVLPSGIWESASDFKKRRRLHSRALNEQHPEDNVDGDEICRYLSADECQDIEDSFVRMAAKTRSRIISHTSQSQIGGNGDLINGLRTTANDVGTNIINAGRQPYTLKTLVILVAWKDQADRREWITRDQIDHMWNGVGADDAIPTGSIKNFTERQAYGTVNFVADVIDWQITDNTEAYYGDGRSAMPLNGDREPHVRTAFHYLLDQMDEQNFPWEDYDSDNDGIVDHVQFLHSGFGAEDGGKDCYTNAPMEDRVWAHALPEGQAKWTSPKTGTKLGAFSTSSVFQGKCGKEMALLGITMHEFYHTLGLPDLYDREQPYAGVKGGLGGLGIFCMMALPFGTNNNQAYPGSLSPWSKLDMGFIKEPIEITKSGTYTARPSNDHPDIYAIKKGYPDGEMLLLENRQNTGFDASLWTGGILIYKIDETQSFNGNKKHGFPGQSDAPENGQSWPSNGLHYPIALLQADGDYDLERAVNNGDRGDFYTNPSQKLGPGNGESVATDKGTYPNTDSYAFGDIQTTGITIDNFQETPEGSGVFTFRVTFEGDDVPTKNPTKKPTTKRPTKAPTKRPTKAPTKRPTKTPTRLPTKSPSKPPIEAPTKPPTKPPTTAPTNNASIDVSECRHILQVNITTDDHPDETTWEILSATTGQYLTGYRSSEDLEPARALETYTEYGWKICVSGSETSHLFRIYDTGLDGLRAPGKYSLSLDGTPIDSGGEFAGDSVTIEFSTIETK